jgi:phytoene/squalene synthetase
MARHGYREEQLHAGVADEAFAHLMADMVGRTRALFDAGRPLLDRVGKDLSFEMRLVWLGGTAILDRIEAARYDVFRSRPTLGLGSKAALLARAALFSPARNAP